MNKKILVAVLFIVVIIIITIFGFVFYSANKIQIAKPSVENNVSSFDTKNATYIIGNENVALVDGKSVREMAPGSASKITTQYFGNEIRGDFNGDKKEDAAFILTQSNGGSGIFYYVAAVVSSPYGYKGTNVVFLGDRIASQTTEFKDGKIIVSYADRKTGEPMTAVPSVGVSKYFKVIGYNLAEVLK